MINRLIKIELSKTRCLFLQLFVWMIPNVRLQARSVLMQERQMLCVVCVFILILERQTKFMMRIFGNSFLPQYYKTCNWIFSLVNWIGPIDTIWVEQCAYHGHGTSNTMNNADDCKRDCLQKPGCTAINYRPTDGNCVFRNCPENVPPPTNSEYVEFKGYYITQGTINEYA